MPAVAAASPVVLGYYADWETSLPPARIDYRAFTHLTHAFATVDVGAALKMPDRERSSGLCRRARAAGVKALLAVGGAESGKALATATATPDSGKRLADALVKESAALGYDGLDIDWEFPEDAVGRDRMNAFVATVRERLPRPKLLTMAVPAADWYGKWFETAALEPHLDLLNVMTYDFHGPWGDHAGPNASFGVSPECGGRCAGLSVEAALGYWLERKRWPANKLVLGIPLYGRGFRAAKWGEPATGTYERSYVGGRQIVPLLKAGWKPGAARGEAPFLSSPDRKEVLSYEDADSARRKGALARERGLAGVFFWEASQDFDGKTFPTVRAARAGLKA